MIEETPPRNDWNKQPLFPAWKWCLFTLLALFAARIALAALTPLTDPSEARYADLCMNMARSGNFVEPQLIHDGEYRTFDGKPPLYFQTGGIACKIFGVNEFSARLPALLCALLIVLMTYGTVRRLSDSASAMRAAMLCALSPFFFLFSGICLTDMTLALAVTGAIFSYLLFSASEHPADKKRYSLGFFFFLGLGMLAKGPVAIVLSGLPVFLWVLIGKRWKELSCHAWVSGSILFLAVAAPWYVIMSLRDPDFLEYFFINENFKRFLVHDYGDKFGAGREFFFGCGAVWFLAANVPAVIFAALPLLRRRKPSAGPRPGCDALLVLPALACVSIALFWSLTSRALLYYLLPTCAFASVAAVRLLERAGLFDRDFFRKFFYFLLTGLALAACAGLAVQDVFMEKLQHNSPRSAYRCALAFLRTENHAPGTKIYLIPSNPYSAEFYVGADKLVLRDKEDLWISAHNSGKHVLVIDRDSLKQLKKGEYIIEDGGRTIPPRKKLGSFGRWEVYAPVAQPGWTPPVPSEKSGEVRK